jgi:DNA repair protein RadD
MTFSLRPYQAAKVSEARALMGQGKKSICLVSPTGSGKTIIAAHIIHSALAKKRRVLFLAHRLELIEQCAEKLRALGIWDYNVVLSGHPQSRNPNAPMQIASIQTLIRREYPPADLIIIDEAHHVCGGQYQTLLKNYPDSYVLGLTATPERLDGKGLDGIFHDLLEVATVPELIDGGFLVTPTCLGPSPEAAAKLKSALAKVKVRGGDYADGALGEAMDHAELVGDIVDHWQEWAVGQKTIVFAASIAHSKHIVEQFQAAGIPAAHLDGTMSTPEREGILSAWRNGDIQVVSNCQILTEGFDFPELSCCVLARPTKSVALQLQMCGRVMRTAPGKNGAVILDHAGNILEHGPPHIDRVWTLQGASKKRKVEHTHACFLPGCGALFVEREAGSVWWVAATQPGIVEQYRFMARKFERMDRSSPEFPQEAKLIVCPACSHAACKFCGHFLKPASDRLICPQCQGEYSSDRQEQEEREKRLPPTCMAGDLVLMDRNGPATEKIRVKNEYNRLLNIAKEKGHKRGWVWWRLKEQFSEAQLRPVFPWLRSEWTEKPASEGEK